jgi:uncharacterized lipoprotein YddW (UPF0748 family)
MKHLKLAALLLIIPTLLCAQKKGKHFTSSHIADPKGGKKLWIWMNPSEKTTVQQYDSTFAVWAKYGVTGVFFEADVEKAFRAAKKHGLEAHRWIWTMNRGDITSRHPEMAAVSRTGKSTAENPPYVDYYRWMCPSYPGVADTLAREVENLCKKDYIDGIHLDYVRFCDVVLPVTLWKNYGIEQQKELPEYDFCYCERCRKAYADSHNGVDPLTMQYPDQSPSWRAFRYQQVVSIVEKACQMAHRYHKPISAAVFPTPEIARRLVRQDWVRFPIDAVFPMTYNSFYDEQPSWIGTAIREGVDFTGNKKPIYAGLFLEGFKNLDELREGVRSALGGGASGVSLYSIPTLDQLKTVNAALK